MDETPSPNDLRRGEYPPTAEMTVSPPPEKPVITDTTSTDTAPISPDRIKNLAANSVTVREQYSREEIHSGPIPDPTTLARFVEIYPNAAKEICAPKANTDAN